jgi:hypothetical protein
MAYDRYGRDRDLDRGYRRDSERGYDRSDRDRHDDRNRSRSYYSRDDDDRGFFDRASDEVRSWFGDEEAERRRLQDERHQREEERSYGAGSSMGAAGFGAFGPMDSYNPYTPYGSPRGDLGSYGEPPRYRDSRDEGRRWRGGEPQESAHDYRSWRDRQLDTFDRDYNEYRRERQSAFEEDFGKWRDTRQTQRQSLKQVRQHMDVVGSDGEHVGTVDDALGDHIKLTKGDSASGGRHHAIPCAWVSTVDTKVTLNRAAADAKRAWQDEDGDQRDGGGDGPHILNRSFSGTY